MTDLISLDGPVTATPSVTIDPACLDIRRKHFSSRITFHAPGLRRYKTTEYTAHAVTEFVSVSLTGTACALNCDHCGANVLKGMTDLGAFDGSLYDLCEQLHQNGAQGVLISGGSDLKGRVPLLKHIPDLIRIRKDLGMVIRVHPGVPDEETIAGLAEVGIDGAMVDIIGHQDTINEVYHMDATVDDYEKCLETLNRYNVPAIPHIILGLHYGKMLGEWNALEIIARHNPKLLVLVILMPISGAQMALTKPPSLEEIGSFFELTRKTMDDTPIMLGCARPLGNMKVEIDRLAVHAGFNGIAYPADGVVQYARELDLDPEFINACCGVAW